MTQQKLWYVQENELIFLPRKAICKWIGLEYNQGTVRNAKIVQENMAKRGRLWDIIATKFFFNVFRMTF